MSINLRANTESVREFHLSNTSSSNLLLTSADAINNAAGFGFNGYDSDGSPRWDLISNLRILNIEVRTVRDLDYTPTL